MTEVAGGKTNREVFEQQRLDAMGGKNAPGVMNKVNPIGDSRSHLKAQPVSTGKMHTLTN